MGRGLVSGRRPREGRWLADGRATWRRPRTEDRRAGVRCKSGTGGFLPSAHADLRRRSEWPRSALATSGDAAIRRAAAHIRCALVSESRKPSGLWSPSTVARGNALCPISFARLWACSPGESLGAEAPWAVRRHACGHRIRRHARAVAIQDERSHQPRCVRTLAARMKRHDHSTAVRRPPRVRAASAAEPASRRRAEKVGASTTTRAVVRVTPRLRCRPDRRGPKTRPRRGLRRIRRRGTAGRRRGRGCRRRWRCPGSGPS